MSLEDRIGIFLAEHPSKIFTRSELRDILKTDDNWSLMVSLKKMVATHEILPIAVECQDCFIMGYKYNLTRLVKESV